MVNKKTDAVKIRRWPNRVLSLALTGNIRTKPKEYAVMGQPTQRTVVFRSCCSVLRAVPTMVESMVFLSRAIAIMEHTTPLLLFTGWCSEGEEVDFTFSGWLICDFRLRIK